MVEPVWMGTEELQYAALQALHTFAFELKSVEMEIVSAGGIPVLVEVLRAGSSRLKDQAIRILVMLSSTEAYASLIVEAGGLEPVAEILKFGWDCPKDSAARVISGLCSEADKDAAVAAGVVEPLVAMLREGNALERYYAAGAVSTLVEISRPVLVDLLAARSLAQLMWDGDGRRMITAAVVRLAYYSQSNRDTLMEAGVVGPLVHLLRSGNEEEKRDAVTALGNLVWKHPENQDIVFGAGVVASMEEMLRFGDDEDKRLAANTLGDLVSNNSAIQLSVAEAATIPLLVDLTKGGSDTARRDAVRALGKLADGNMSLQTSVGDAGAIQVITDILWNSNSLNAELKIARPTRRGSWTRERGIRYYIIVIQWLSGEAKE